MDKQKINNTIAEIIGYTNIRQEWILGIDKEDYCGMDALCWYGNYNNWDRRPIPSFTDRLDSMHDAENTLNSAGLTNHRIIYIRHLMKVLKLCPPSYAQNEAEVFSQVNAMAEQKAEAFLKAFDRWEDDEKRENS